jgi:hypothetical protein
MTLPTPISDERRAIDHLTAQFAMLMPSMRNSHENLARMLADCLRRGDLIVTIKAVNAAERHGDWLADAVLRATYADMANRGEPISDQLRAFGERAVLRPPVERGRGRDQYADWSRNNAICFMIQRACAEFGVRPTRSRSARRDRIQSGCSLVKKALERHGIFIEEKTIQDNIWLGLPGELGRRAMAELEIGECFPIPQ